jgi:hypothetical protein
MTTDSLVPLPRGMNDFAALRLGGAAYADKTRGIYDLAKDSRKILLTRPHFFGKTLLLSTLRSLFEDGLAHFAGLEIETLWKERKTYRVVSVDLEKALTTRYRGEFSDRLMFLLSERFKPAGFISGAPNLAVYLEELSAWLAGQPSESLVLLIDNADAPVTLFLEKPEKRWAAEADLARFYAVLHAHERVFRFLLAVQTTNLAGEKLASEMQFLEDISYDHRSALICGITTLECKKYFPDYLARAAEVRSTTASDVLDDLEAQYGGYCYDLKYKKTVLNPCSLLHFFAEPGKGFVPYWMQERKVASDLRMFMRLRRFSQPHSFDSDHKEHLDALKNKVLVPEISEVVPMAQAGYLTVTASRLDMVHLRYPNIEVRRALAGIYSAALYNEGSLCNEALCEGCVSFTEGNPTGAFLVLTQGFSLIKPGLTGVPTPELLGTYAQIFLESVNEGDALRIRRLGTSSAIEIRTDACRWVLDFMLGMHKNVTDERMSKAVQKLREDYPPEGETESLYVVFLYSVPTRSLVRWTVA